MIVFGFVGKGRNLRVVHSQHFPQKLPRIGPVASGTFFLILRELGGIVIPVELGKAEGLRNRPGVIVDVAST